MENSLAPQAAVVVFLCHVESKVILLKNNYIYLNIVIKAVRKLNESTACRVLSSVQPSDAHPSYLGLWEAAMPTSAELGSRLGCQIRTQVITCI